MTSNKTPIASVIIPTYNRANFLTKAIDSVLDQTFKDYEIIVVDDGSTDDTREVLESYSDKIQYIHTKHSGVSAARNAGIQLAKGEWIAFLDSDDEWLPQYLSFQMRRVMQNPKICTHITNSIQISIDGKTVNTFQDNIFMLSEQFKRNSCLTIERPLCFVIKHQISTLQATIMRRDALLKTGLFNTNLTIAEDLDIIARMALQGPLGICDITLVYMYRREESIENLAKQLENEGAYSCECHGKVYNNLSRLEKLSLKEKRIVASALSSNRRALANLLLRYGKKIEARKYFKEALLTSASIKSLIKYLLSFLPTRVALLFIIKKGTSGKLGKGV